MTVAAILNMANVRAIKIASRIETSLTDSRSLTADRSFLRHGWALGHTGPAWKALIEEEFGDGIMSAIDFDMAIERLPDFAVSQTIPAALFSPFVAP